MRDFKRFLAQPTRLMLALPLITLGLAVTVFVQVTLYLHAAAGETFPWFSFSIATIILLLLGAMTAVRSFMWMYREYPARMHEIDTARRTAVRNANGDFRKYLAALRHTPLPLVVIVLGWLFAGVLAAGVVIFATGVLG